MKKIFVILLVLFVGLLVGCASKPAVVKDFSTSFEDSSYSEEYEKETKIIESIINKKVITCDEWQPCRWYGKDTRCSIETDRTDLTIKIVNTTDKPLYLQFCSTVNDRTTKDYFRRYFYAILNPKETGVYNIYDFISLKENCLGVEFWNFDENRYSKLWNWSQYHFEEIIKNHSLEILYGISHEDDGICKYEYNFIEPFECPFNMEWKSEYYSYENNNWTYKIYEKGEKNINNYSSSKVLSGNNEKPTLHQ